ncbi:TetR/AcrR family transcriptional regulator C-terminal domain-containing protein [Faecalicatena contorta]|uniref:Probable dihydroxyacetone kinase regulator n=1 Tax=Faecalicatena contorta TaxID=39482 RepID=A0A315ZW91_9FIRM|nr:TetR/AcrR family transcriptional regulator C-terminal domain-containing protein [Faecalicatena contorta]PWJ49911.1 TetR family transcriptional regulator [Faecalicatena contorta]SUQ14032.1 probable dihydroxyacetone kinase regulator [Faecalicatena contorta]
MTHKETSLRTKKALCASLKELMRHKAFSKITVSELIRDCDINRKTFYYHFEDIFGLLKWMLEQEAIDVVKQFDLLIDFQDAFVFVIDYVEANSYFLNCIYNSVGRDELKRFFYQDFIGLVETIISKNEKKVGTTISDGFRFFLCDLYTEGIAGMIINLFQHPDKYTKEDLIDYFTIVMHNSIPAVIISQKQ